MNMRFSFAVVAAVCGLCFVGQSSGQGFGPAPIANTPTLPPPCKSDCPCHLSSARLSKCWNPKTKSQCDGTQSKCRTVLKAATGNGSCELNTTALGLKAKVGDTTCETIQCNTGSCPHSPVAPFVGPCDDPKTKCQNGGNCVLDIDGKAVCQCPTAFSGAQCQTAGNANDKCVNGGACKAPAKCYNVAAAPGYVCHCPKSPPSFGPDCSLTPCTPNPCKNGGTCSSTSGSAMCKCPTTAGAKGGPICDTAPNTKNTCKTQKDPADMPVLCVKNGGKCIDYPFSPSRCQCPSGKNGPSCSKTGEASNSCNNARVLQCVMRSTGFDPSTAKGKCDSYTTYAKCALDAGCTNVMKVWCYSFFVQHPKCQVLSDAKYCAKKVIDSCDIKDYEACYAQVDVNNLSTAAAASALADCAAQADCQQLRYNFCLRTDGTNPNCHNVPQENVDFTGTENLPSASMLFPREDRKASSSTAIPAVVALVAVVAVGVAVFVVRRRRDSSTPTDELEVELQEA